jgi:glycosyltransferase involved in cell wall biosynthesis
MKTILIAHNYSEVSFAAMSYHLANYLAEKGHKVVFISHQPYFEKKQIITKDKGQLIVYSWPSTKRPTRLSDFLWYGSIHRAYKPEIIIGHFVGSNIAITVSKFLSFGKVKTFEYYHTLSSQLLADHGKINLKQSILFLRKKLFYKHLCDTLVCPSELAKKDARHLYAIDKSIVLLNPMPDRFLYKAVLPTDVIVVSFLGRLDPSKGVINLVAAFKKYKERIPSSKIVLRIAGTGAEQLAIQEMIVGTAGIEFLGGLSYDAIDAYLSQTHFTIIPSKFDNLPTVGLESLMNQTPLLISNTTGLTPYVTDGVDCFKFEPTIDGIIKMLERVETNTEKWEAMAIAARLTFTKNFSIETYCNAFLKIIENELK